MTNLFCNSIMNKRVNVTLASLLMATAVLSGCGDKAKASTQVAAKINDEEITISQVNAALSTIPVVPGKTIDDAKKEVLDNLIVQNLADQQAVKMKLDRKPEVMQSIESAKNTILARAYMDPIITGIPKPTPAEMHKFYEEHPELFANRKIFNLRELEVESKPELAASIREMAGKGESLDAIAASLKSKNITSTIQSGVKPAEQLPLEMLTRLSQLPSGKLMVVELSKSISVLQVVSVKAEPVTENMATPVIQEYLNNSRKKEALEKEIKALKAGAKIEYFGEFQPGAKTAVAEAKPAAMEADGKATEQASVPDIAKGVGLK
ncbi:MAG: EpsD family peptidyl-prolyl cis-trans isomerase [Gammaproteobacteria bacterium]|nr:EpsD family peptidyl-prolyl cis-trans isomerase [Gammaproteobacteria bacterium]MBU1481725.1 EpsD family peptidyl-prolyl cis-trans isomerase [Gammaproteobacteria bacterium]